MVERPATFDGVELGDKLLGDEMFEIGAELVAQRFLLGGVVEVHGLTLPGARPE
jgi:hypothetical protein